MDWSAARTGIETLVKSIVGSDFKVVWRFNKQTKGWDTGKRAICRFHPSIRLSQRDDTYLEYNSGAASGSQMEIRTGGQRRVNLSILLESHSSLGDLDAFYYAELLSNRMELPSSLSQLDALGFGLVGNINVIDLSNVGYPELTKKAGKFILSTANVEFELNYAINEDDTATTWIETLDVETRFLDEEGNLVDNNFDGDVVIG